MSGLAAIPEHDFRDGGLPAYAHHRRAEAAALMDAVLGGLGLRGTLLRPLLPAGDRIAARWLTRADDPYRHEILALPGLLGRAGPVAFSLSHEFGCTTRVFATGGPPRLFRTLDWPFRGLGHRIEVVHLSGAAGDWVTATWPGVMGALHGAAPGRFAAALNQAPERRTGLGRAADWAAAKRRFLRTTGLPPAHLLRQVFEQAPDYPAARALLAETPVAVPVIFTLTGTAPGEACVIERTEADGAVASSDIVAAANHFVSPLARTGRWRGRGQAGPDDSEVRFRAAQALDETPQVDRLAEPILNPLTRLALVADGSGRVSVTGYEGLAQATRPHHVPPEFWH